MIFDDRRGVQYDFAPDVYCGARKRLLARQYFQRGEKVSKSECLQKISALLGDQLESLDAKEVLG